MLAQLIQHPVVKEDVRAVQARDDHALVVARIAQQRAVGAIAVGDPRDILVHAAGADPQLRSHRPVLRWRRTGRGEVPGPPPNTESRSSAGVRVFGEVNGFCGTPSCEV